MDAVDYKILQQLLVQGRITWSELANGLGLSAPATAERVRRLEEHKVILGYTAQVNPAALDYRLTAFIAVSLQHPQARLSFLQRIQGLPEVLECHHMTGEDDYLLKVRSRHTQDLERIISEEIKGLPGILRTRTTIVLSTVKETLAVPLGDMD
ncbi:MAG: Lrp/AsnC family transcriptional regulator [Oscillatoriales cyanobacterium RM2_1_1]|nr:Lrp/AsnC family transcriptional regulator [Oscillatoriales cyanobacterium RM2_1_1]